MAQIDQEAANREVEKAAACNAQADELETIAGALREHARDHLREADELRGHPARLGRPRSRR
jgi:hypothetical protein